jgi:hypothetical protein
MTYIAQRVKTQGVFNTPPPPPVWNVSDTSHVFRSGGRKQRPRITLPSVSCHFIYLKRSSFVQHLCTPSKLRVNVIYIVSFVGNG